MTTAAPSHHHAHHEGHGGKAATAGTSFIDRVKVQGVNALMGAFMATGSRFDRVLEGMVVTALSEGRVTCTMTVTEGVQNAYSTLHGGAVCTLVDVVGTVALLTVDVTKPGVSVDLSTTFIAAAKAGETIRIEGRVLKHGKRLGFTEVTLYRAADGTMLATGRHTKAL